MSTEQVYISLLGSDSTNMDQEKRSEGEKPTKSRLISLSIELNNQNEIVLAKDKQDIPSYQDSVNNNNNRNSNSKNNSNNSNNCTNEDPRDGAWGWVVVLASFVCLCVLDGVSYSFGVFLGPLMAELGGGRGEIASAGSIQTGIYAVSGLAVAKLVDRYGTRPVCIAGAVTAGSGLILSSYAWNLASLLVTYSLITGIGFGMMYIPAIVAVAEHFNKRRSLALGICVCGTGVGTFILAPMESYLLDNLGWRWTVVCLGCVCLCCVLCGAVMSPIKVPEEDTTETADSINAKNNHHKASRSGILGRVMCFILGPELACHPNLTTYLLLVLADAVGTLALFVPFTYLPELAMAVGVNSDSAALLLSAGGISSSVGRILSGWLNDQKWCNPICLTAAVVGLAALPPFLLTFCTAFWSFMLFTCLFGLLSGVWIAATTPFLLKVLPIHLLTPAFGLITATQGGAALAGTPLAGMAVDFFANISMALMFAGCLLSMSSAFFAISYFYNRRKEFRAQYESLA